MKKSYLVVFCCLILAGCERPATIGSWSPINDVNTPAPASTQTAVALLMQTPITTQKPTIAEITPMSTLDLAQFPNPLPDSMKGYELVSWQTDETWYFTLVTGTNREKTFDELTQPDSQVTDDGYVKITVAGVDQIKEVLARLPANSEVLWSGMDLAGQVPEGMLYFTYPEAQVIEDLIAYCAQLNITLLDLAEAE